MALHIFRVQGRAMRKGIDFHDFGIKNEEMCLFLQYLYKIGYIF